MIVFPGTIFRFLNFSKFFLNFSNVSKIYDFYICHYDKLLRFLGIIKIITQKLNNENY